MPEEAAEGLAGVSVRLCDQREQWGQVCGSSRLVLGCPGSYMWVQVGTGSSLPAAHTAGLFHPSLSFQRGRGGSGFVPTLENSFFSSVLMVTSLTSIYQDWAGLGLRYDSLETI